MQISSKVALSISLVVVLAGALATSVALQGQEGELRSEHVKMNKEALQLLALSVAPAVAKRHHHRVQAVLDNIANFEKSFPDVRTLEVIGNDGRVIAALDPTRFNLVVADEQALARYQQLDEPSSRVANNTLHLVVPLQLAHQLGVIRASFSQERLGDYIERQRNFAVGLLLATMLLIGVALHFIHRKLVGGRLSGLAKAAGAIGDGRMDVEASIEGKDEIAELGASFNNMAKAIKLYTEDLEHIIAERTDELETANARLEQLATTDQLTGAWNRRYFDDSARRAIEVARRNERPLCIVLVDADKFKSINDTFGHPVGDVVLKTVAQTLRDNARKADLVARVGGEEFAILMPEAGIGLAAQGAERMRGAIESEVSPQVPELGDRVVTASFGVASFERAGDRLEDLLSAADEAMYASKESGRNRVTVANRSSQTGEEVAQ